MSLSILFVEDEPGIREELIPFLKRYAKKELYVAVNGKEGLKLYVEYQPDIVISDIRMPQMDGIEMVKEIKAIDPAQAVLFTTAHSDSTFFLDAIELQIAGYLLKPIDLRSLAEKIKKIKKDITLEKKYELQKTIVNEIAHLQGNMVGVLDHENIPLFLNQKWLDLLGIDTLEEIDDKRCISAYFQKQEGYFYPSGDDVCYWVNELKAKKSEDRIVAMKTDENDDIKTYAVSFVNIEKTDHLIVSFSEITHIEKERSSYRKQASTDELTQLYNRTGFNNELKHALDAIEFNNEELSIILFDLDHFKRVNDTYGHLIGDKILIELSAHMKTLIRTNDRLARWGGEEFVALLPNTDIKGAMILAEKMRESIEKYPFFHDIPLTCSFGVACISDKNETATSLFDKADKALYKAKRAGRNRVIAYE